MTDQTMTTQKSLDLNRIEEAQVCRLAEQLDGTSTARPWAGDFAASGNAGSGKDGGNGGGGDGSIA